MRDFTLHLAPLPRRHSLGFPVKSVGYMSNKTNFVDHSFLSINFSLILSGRGEYRCQGRSWSVIAPCVITQAPGIHYHYGPSQKWEELYFIYASESQAVAEARGLYRQERPVWFLKESGILRSALVMLYNMQHKLHHTGNVDRIDRLCESVVMESLLQQAQPQDDPIDQRVLLLKSNIDASPEFAVSLEKELSGTGIHPFAFRRHWNRLVGCPPLQYQTRTRMQWAARRLVETGRSIAEIAQEVGFKDALYFSRQFKKAHNISATEYRRIMNTDTTRP